MNESKCDSQVNKWEEQEMQIHVFSRITRDRHEKHFTWRNIAVAVVRSKHSQKEKENREKII